LYSCRDCWKIADLSHRRLAVNRSVRRLVALIASILPLAAHAAGPRSIFDDDWIPPKPSATPRPANEKSAPKEAAPDGTPARPSDDANPTAPATATRRPIPTKAEQSTVRAVLKEAYAEQLVDRSIPARRKLTKTLLGQADKSANNPVDRFVLLAAAVDAGIEAANLPLAFQAGDQMAAIFDVDVLALKADVATKLTPKPGAAALAAENIRAALDLVNELLAGDDFVPAARVCAAIMPVAAADPALRADVQRRQRDVALARDAREKIAKSIEKLKTTPEDPAANLAVGRYACFIKGDWARGLPMLAAGSDPTLKALAAQESAAATDADALLHLADGWWDAAAKQPDLPARNALVGHAATLYKRSLDGASPLRRVQVEKRIAEAARLTPVSTRVAREFVVEAMVDTVCTLHVTPKGIYWTNQEFNKPGMHDGADEPTYVDGVAWKPRWSKPGSRGTDTSEPYPIRIGAAAADFKAEVIGCAPLRGSDKLEQRDPIRTESTDGEFLVTIPDTQSGARWYRLRITYKQ
jgi:hypothetical protein